MISLFTMRHDSRTIWRVWMALALCLGCLSLMACDRSSGVPEREELRGLTGKGEPAEVKRPGRSAPPLLPAVDEDGKTLDDYLRAGAESPSRVTGKFKSDDNSLYRWTDESGTVHTVSGRHLVPLPYRESAEAIGKLPERKGPDQARNREYNPDSFDRQANEQDAERKRWRSRYQKSLAAVTKLESTLKNIENNEPDCVKFELYEDIDTDPDCVAAWEKKLQSVKDSLAAAIEEAKRMPEEGRKAGIPPGIFR